MSPNLGAMSRRISRAGALPRASLISCSTIDSILTSSFVLTGLSFFLILVPLSHDRPHPLDWHSHLSQSCTRGSWCVCRSPSARPKPMEWPPLRSTSDQPWKVVQMCKMCNLAQWSGTSRVAAVFQGSTTPTYALHSPASMMPAILPLCCVPKSLAFIRPPSGCHLPCEGDPWRETCTPNNRGSSCNPQRSAVCGYCQCSGVWQCERLTVPFLSLSLLQFLQLQGDLKPYIPNISTTSACCALCQDEPKCVAWVLETDTHLCFLKAVTSGTPCTGGNTPCRRSMPNRISMANCPDGPTPPPPPPPAPPVPHWLPVANLSKPYRNWTYYIGQFDGFVVPPDAGNFPGLFCSFFFLCFSFCVAQSGGV